MRTEDIFTETYSSLTVNKVRSGLTILGIVIGIASVIAMVAIGQGAQGAIEQNIQSLGSNLILVQSGAARGPGTTVSAGRGNTQTLTLADATAIVARADLAAAVSPELTGRYQVTAKGTNTNTQVVGVVSAYPEARNVQIDRGTFISEQQARTTAKVAVLGPTARDDLFGPDADALGQKIRIKNIQFTVVGITVAKGGSGFSNQDDIIYVPLATAQQYLTGGEFVSTIAVQAADATNMAALQQQITDILLEQHRISDPAAADFSTINQSDIIAAASSITETFTLLLGSVAGISLVVGGIGIMNMMLTTVTERTREIGLRKAIGAKRGEIRRQFLLESILLTTIGGILGLGLGCGVALLISRFGGVTTSVSWPAVMLALGVSGGIGIVFGTYPANRAAKMNPIEALRYE